VTPEQLLSRYVFRQGVCWRCEEPSLVAGLTDLMPDGQVCPLCVIRLDQLQQADFQRHAMSVTGRTLTDEEAAALWPRPRTAEEEAPLRAWLTGLMRPLDGMPGAYGIGWPDREHGTGGVPASPGRCPRQAGPAD